jgi:hypothetical protein
MGIRIHKTYLAYHSITCNAVEPEYMGWQPEDIEEYLKDHPMPQDENYSKEDMITDLTDTTGALTFTDDLKPETLEFIADLMNWLEDEPIKEFKP